MTRSIITTGSSSYPMFDICDDSASDLMATPSSSMVLTGSVYEDGMRQRDLMTASTRSEGDLVTEGGEEFVFL